MKKLKLLLLLISVFFSITITAAVSNPDLKDGQGYSHDIRVWKILNLNKYYNPGDEITPTVIVKNIGENAETFDVACNVFKGTDETLVYSDTITVSDLDVYKKDTLIYNPLTLSSPDQVYLVRFTNLLETDENPVNDSIQQYIYSYTKEKNLVIVEIGTGTGCGYCVGAALGADDLVENGQPVAILEYHAYNANDPFITAASLWRAGSYYSIASFPTTFFDGTLIYWGGDNSESIYDDYLPLVEQQMQVKTGIDIKLTPAVTGKNFDVTVTVDKEAPVMDNFLELHIALTESDIPYEWQSLDKIDFTVRDMLNDGHGTEIDLINNETVTYTASFEIQPDWNMDNMEVVAFVQNKYSKEILNGTKDKLVSVGVNDKPMRDQNFSIYPNPVSGSFNLDFDLEENAVVSVDLLDITGRVVKNLTTSKTMSRGPQHLRYNLQNNLSKAMYLLRIKINDQQFLQKLVIE
jgi:hypothetical protein